MPQVTRVGISVLIRQEFVLARVGVARPQISRLELFRRHACAARICRHDCLLVGWIKGVNYKQKQSLGAAESQGKCRGWEIVSSWVVASAAAVPNAAQTLLATDDGRHFFFSFRPPHIIFFFVHGQMAHDDVRPFEWLTSAESLHERLDEVLQGREGANVLHVGCGSSVLGEHIVQHHHPNVRQVVNVDHDANILCAMQNRWKERCKDDIEKVAKMKFVEANICADGIPLDDGSMDVVVDKSTLDCLLCSDKGASALISEIYRLLDPDKGVYLLISFHHMDLLLPMLQECPGTEWTFSHSVMYRHVEALGNHSRSNQTGTKTTDLAQVAVPEIHSSAWTANGFQPDEVYHRTVNVLIGRKRVTKASNSPALDVDKVYAHVNACSDRWYQQQNPILTHERTHQIRQDFATSLPLQECYQVLFTEEEREHLTYEGFLEDWAIFLENHPDLVEKEAMSGETALLFLSVMQ